MQQYTYLIILLSTISVPLLLSFHPKVKMWRFKIAFIPAIFISSIPFLILDNYFTKKGIWGFNYLYVTGNKIFQLPIEEVLFFIITPFATLFLYELSNSLNLKSYRLGEEFKKLSWFGLIALYVLSAGHTYTLIIAITGLVFTILYNRIPNPLKTDPFYGAYMLTSLIGFLVINTILTALPVVTYNFNEISGIRIGTIPIEDFIFFYIMNTLYLWVYLILKNHLVRIEVNTVQSA